MESTPLVLTFDVGTQSARCLLVKPDGSFEDIEQIKYREAYFSKKPGWAEQRPDFYYDRICEAGKEICKRNHDKLKDVIAVTLTIIRDTVICLDKDKKPLRDIILWLDNRQAEYDDPFPTCKRTIFKTIGMDDATKVIYKATAANWIKQNEPEIWRKTDKFVMISAYLNYKMTGNLIDSEANIIGHFPFDYKNRKWKSKTDITRCITDVPNEKLCNLIKSGEVVGTISKEFSLATDIPEGLQLIATGSDKGCETLGLSVTKPYKAALSYGTSSTIQMAVKKYFEPQQFMPAYPGVPNDIYNPEIEIYRGFWMLSWFIKEFGAEERIEAEEKHCSPEQLFDKYIEKIPAGCGGLLLQPYWTPGVANPYGRGCVIGFSDYHNRYHFYRAIIEGVCFELYDSLKIMEKRSGVKITEIYVGGGGAKSNIVCQITADIFGLPVKRIQTYEASSIGSSMVAFIAKGIFDNYDDAISHMVQIKDVFYPNIENHLVYSELYNKAYRKIFGKLEPIYRKIIKFYKRRDNDE